MIERIVIFTAELPGRHNRNPLLRPADRRGSKDSYVGWEREPRPTRVSQKKKPAASLFLKEKRCSGTIPVSQSLLLSAVKLAELHAPMRTSASRFATCARRPRFPG
jgi:hypothetical protein